MAEYLGDIDNINFSNSIYLDRNFDHSLSRAYPLNNNSFFNTQEMVEYVVIPKPAISIAGTAVSSNLQYSAIMDITYHTIVNVSARQPFLYKILTPKGVYYHKALLTDVPLIGFKHFDPPKNVHELERILEHTPYFDLINDYNEHDMEVRPDKGLLSELKEVDSDYDLKSEKASEGLKICSIFSKE